MRSSSRPWLWGALVLILALGCTSQEGVAQEPAPDKATQAKAKKAKKDKKKVKDKRDYTATIRDKHQGKDDKPFAVSKVVVFVPEVSLFGGGSGEEIKELELKKGSATLEVAFARIAKIEIGKQKEDRLELTLTLRPAKGGKAPPPLKGTVKASLELRGTYALNELPCTVKLREAVVVELAPTKK